MTRFQDLPPLNHWMHTGRDVGSHPYPIPSTDRFLMTNLEIPAFDGTILRGDLYVPHGDGPFPTVYEATPYGAQGLAKYGSLYATRGYLFLAVDCRGRYRSQGKWEPLTWDQCDGHAIIKWLIDHPLCNGAIGIRGHSYAGYSQLLTAIDAPEELKALVVGVAPGDPFSNTPFQGGCYDLNDLFWLFDMTGRVDSDSRDEKQNDLDLDDDLEGDHMDDDEDEDSPEEQEHDALLDAALKSVPFQDLDLRLGIYHETFRDWIRHWQQDDYWKARSVLPHISKIRAAILHISGWWDGNGRGATQFFRALRRHAGSREARENQQLLMGAYDHDLQAPDCDDLPEHEAQAIERASLRDCLNDEIRWFDRFLRHSPDTQNTDNRVTLFVTGVNRWTTLDDWPPHRAREERWYLDKTAGKSNLSLNLPKENHTFLYPFDPLDPTPFGHEDVDAERMPFDNSALQKKRKDLLLFDTAPFSSTTAYVGEIRAEIYAASPDLADFDIACSLYDVYPDGRSIFLTDGIRRARFVKGYESPQLLPLGTVGRFEIDLWHLGHIFRTNHFLRLQIASASYLRFDVNSGTGGNLSRETSRKGGTVVVHTGATYPSLLVLSRIDLQNLFRHSD